MEIKVEVPDDTNEVKIECFKRPSKHSQFKYHLDVFMLTADQLQSMTVPSEPCEWCKEKWFVKKEIRESSAHCKYCGRDLRKDVEYE